MLLKNYSYHFLFRLFILFIFIFSPFVSSATAQLLTDDFTGTTINVSKWTETDAGGVGGTVGNVQQNGSLTLTGSAVWGANYLVTNSTYDRAMGGLEMEADITCTASSSIFGVGYGDPGILTGGGQSYTVYAVSSVVYFSRQLSNTNAESVSTGFNCVNGTPFHIRIAIDATIGASVYINGSGTPAVTLTGGVFTNKGFFLSGHSGSASVVDNFVISSAINLTEPGSPTSLNANPASTQMALTWTAPISNGGAAITDYKVEYKLSTEPTVWTIFADGTSTATSALVTGLTNGLSYDFRVSATNSVGTGVVSNTATATPALSVPSAPQSLIASNSESSQSALTWTAPISNGGAAITDYKVEYKLSTEPTVWTIFADGTSTATSALVTGLTNGLSYDFRVSATNSVGTGVVSNTATATPSFSAMMDDFTGTTINVSKWTEVDATGLGGTSGRVRQNGSLNITPSAGSWGTQDGVSTVETFDRTNGDVSIKVDITRDSCGSGVGPVALGYGDIDFTTPSSASYIFLSNSTNWELYYWLGGTNQANSPQTLSGLSSCTNGVPITFELVALQAGGAKVYVNGSLTASATYGLGAFTNKSFWIGGYQAGGTISYDNVIITEPVSGPYSPTGLTANALDGQVSLSWTPGGDNGSAITDYIIQYKLNSAGSWLVFSDGTSISTSATVTGLTNGALYNFRVLAVNDNGASDPSSTASARPISQTPTVPIASSIAIVGAPSIGEIIVGSYIFNDVNGDSEATSLYRWLRSDTVGGAYSEIVGATSINYTITQSDLNKYLKFEVTPVSNVSPTTGLAILSLATSQISEIDYVNQILSTGQSLSVGVASTPALTTTQPYSNLMLTGGSGGIGAGGSFTPLIESGVETISSSMANTITANDVGNDFDVAVSLHGVSGYTYSQLKKGTGPYANGMTQVTNAKSAATALSRTSRVIGVTTIHGETDNYNNVSGATYQGYLEEWQDDYDTDVKAITGQSGEVPLYLCQMSSFMSSYANDATSEIPIYQLKASVDNPGEIILVAPKYFFNYSDRHHLTGASSRWLGEYYGKVIKKVTIDHEAWRPLSPDVVTRSGNIIYADFHVPSGVLAFDTTLVSARTNKGFEYYDSTSSATISNVEILDSDTVKITLSNTPTGANQRLRYAYTGVPGTNTGAQNAGSAAGNLRDTDSYPSLYGNTLYNWAVHFDEEIILDSTNPNVTGFSIPSTANSLTVDITTFTATDDTSVAGYLLTETADTPSAGDVGWTANAPTTYTFSTRGAKTLYAWAKDSAGNISTSLNDSITITLAPNSPTGITATAGNTQASVTFSAPVDNGGSEITGYTVISSPAGGTDSNQGSTNLSHLITGLTNGTAYTFTVTATNAVGASSSSSASNQITPVDGDNPILSSITGTPSDTSATISWTTDEASSSIVEYGLTNTYGEETTEEDTSPRVTSHSVNIGSLIACTTYHYRVKSTDGATNTATGNDNVFTTTGCTGDGEVISNTNEEITTDTGGTLNLAGGDSNGLTLTIPPDFLALDANFQAQQLDSSTVIAIISTPTGLSSVGSYVYELQALTDTSTLVSSFDEPLTITFSYNPSDIPNIDESTLSIYRYDGTTWNALTDCSVNTNLNTVTCSTTHFSLFGLFGLPRAEATSTRSTGFSIHYGCKDPKALNYEYFSASNPALCKYQTVTPTFTRNLKYKMEGEDVKALQVYLNTHGYTLATTGVGSLGNETNYFGKLTKKAVIKFQLANKLIGDGIVGPVTKSYFK